MKLSRKKQKAQSGMELIAGIGFIFLVFMMFALLAYEKSSQSQEFKSLTHAKAICKSFAMNVNTISEQGHSYFKYFSLPEKIYGNYDYNLTNYGNRVEISWESKKSPYSLPIVTQNLTIYCLDKGKWKKNRIFNDQGSIIVTCYRADLKPLEETFKPTKVNSGETVNLSIKVKNYGVLPSGEFTILFNSQEINISSLEVEEIKEIKVEYTAPPTPGNYSISIFVDSYEEIQESIEEDNSLNLTLGVE